MARARWEIEFVPNWPVLSRLQRGLDVDLSGAGGVGVRRARFAAPNDTGNLDARIRWREDGDNAIAVVSDAEYSKYVEYGTRHMKAQPFIRESFSNRETFNEVADSAGDELRRLGQHGG